MKAEDLKALAEETGFPSAYDHFAEGETPDPPFLIYRFNGSDNFAADGIVYHPIDEVHLELYTNRKDPESESAIEALLNKRGLFYQKSEVWIAEERLYEVLYQMED